MHLSFLTAISATTEEILQGIEGAENIVRYSSLILRVADDLGTSSDEIERGNNLKSIQCYMHETGATEEEARKYIELLIIKTWKKLNKAREGAKSRFSWEFNNGATNLARFAQYMCSNRDGYGRPYLTKSQVISPFFNPILGIE
ncbi:unnamed protein product [Lactuca saligna]|uniref:Terpene synthase metal-binding domain-containing protein n=1 Tax=Lactuca saligna TaxID=75948 RepID=A0AA36EKY6_LACSI|nr:unnamed protein product [Lactuca saligna]